MIKEAIREAVEPKMAALFKEVRQSYGAKHCAYPYVPVVQESYSEGPRILICGKGAGSWGLQYARIEGIGKESTLACVHEEGWYPEVLRVQEAFIENGPKRYLSGESGGYAKGAWWRSLYMVIVHALQSRKVGERWDRSMANPEDATFFFSNVAFTNLDKVARKKNNLDRTLRKIHDDYYTLKDEIEVLWPSLVWFPTGPSYDKHLCKALPGFKTEELSGNPGMAKVHGLDGLMASGGVAFRTYHPQYGKFRRIPVINHIKHVNEQCHDH